MSLVSLEPGVQPQLLQPTTGTGEDEDQSDTIGVLSYLALQRVGVLHHVIGLRQITRVHPALSALWPRGRVSALQGGLGLLHARVLFRNFGFRVRPGANHVGGAVQPLREGVDVLCDDVRCAMTDDDVVVRGRRRLRRGSIHVIGPFEI